MRDYRASLQGLEVDGCSTEGLSKRATDFLCHELQSIAHEEFLLCNSSPHTNVNATDLLKATNSIAAVLNFYVPNIDKDLPNAFYMWPNMDSRKKGRSGRCNMKLGRAIKRMFPVLADSEIDNLVDKVKAEFFSSEPLYIKSGTCQSSFQQAYTMKQSDSQNVCHSHSKKHMAGSCMRYEFDQLPNHPTEAYASGDFVMYWVENSRGLVAARCVVCVSKEGIPLSQWQAAPIYANTEQAYRELYEHLSDSSNTGGLDKAELNCCRSNWEGALMLSISHGGGKIGPYLDLEPRALTEIRKDSKFFLKICEDGEYDASCYGGILYEVDRHKCIDCDCTINDDDYYSSDHTHEIYCHDCYYEVHFNCDCCGEDNLRSGSQEVHNPMRLYGPSLWCSDCTSEDSTLITVGINEGQRHENTYVHVLQDGDVISQEEFDERWTICYLSCEVVETKECVALENDNLAILTEVEDYNQELWNDHSYILNTETNIWELKPRNNPEGEHNNVA